LLLAPLLSLMANALEDSNVVFGSNRVEAFVKGLFWPEPDGARETIVVLVRDGIFGLAALVGVFALLGLRASRWPVALISAVLAVLYLPWLIWDFDVRTFRHLPPDWVVKYLPWYQVGRYVALLWILVLLAAVVFALAERPATTVVTTDATAPTAGTTSTQTIP
jgi:hypothetical protein